MTKQEVYTFLDIDSPKDFQYIEQFSDLLECQEEIPIEIFFDVFSEIADIDAGDFAEHYIEDLIRILPDDDDLNSILSDIEDRLLMLAENLQNPESRKDFIEELYKFRTWYIEENGCLIDKKPASLMEAAAESRLERLGGEKHDYDFSKRLFYEPKELSLNLGKFQHIDMEEN